MVLDDYQSRLKWAMNRAGMDIPALAKALGVSYQEVKKATQGGTKMLAADNHIRAAQLLGVDALWLATGEGSYRGQGPLSAELHAALARADPWRSGVRRTQHGQRLTSTHCSARKQHLQPEQCPVVLFRISMPHESPRLGACIRRIDEPKPPRGKLFFACR